MGARRIDAAARPHVDEHAVELTEVIRIVACRNEVASDSFCIESEVKQDPAIARSEDEAKPV